MVRDPKSLESRTSHQANSYGERSQALRTPDFPLHPWVSQAKREISNHMCAVADPEFLLLISVPFERLHAGRARSAFRAARVWLASARYSNRGYYYLRFLQYVVRRAW